MTDERKVFGEVEIVESDERYKTMDAFPNSQQTKVQHDRFSLKFESELRAIPVAIAIQPFVDESTPDHRFGVHLDPVRVDDYMGTLVMIQNRLNELGV